MLRRIALTLVPSVALFTVAVIADTAPAGKSESQVTSSATRALSAPSRAATRSGYIVASS